MKSSPLIIANWKMKLAREDALALAKKLAKAAPKWNGAEVAVCPSFTEIAAVADLLRGTDIALGAQDCFWEESGAFTGGVSPSVLRDMGAAYVIAGHSERRQHFGETNEMIHKKIRLLLSLGLTPVLCIGETFEERQEGQKDAVLLGELHAALNGIWLPAGEKLVVAYEPIWVIGSGQAVDPEEAEHTHRVIKQALYDLFPDGMVDEQVRILYGGSVDPENVGGFMRQKTVDGVLVGNASLDASVFSALIASAAKFS